MPSSQYQAYVAELVTACLASETKSITRLVAALGCKNIRYVSRGCYVDIPTQPNPEYEPFVLQEILAALRRQIPNYRLQQTDSLSLLDGLMYEDRWRTCLEREDDTYSLIAQFLYFTWLIDDLLRKPGTKDIREILVPPVLSVLNEWLAPATPFLNVPHTMELVRVMFGDTWYALALPDVSSLSMERTIGLVLGSRPPLRPGLLPVGVEAIAIDLPSLE